MKLHEAVMKEKKMNFKNYNFFFNVKIFLAYKSQRHTKITKKQYNMNMSYKVIRNAEIE